MVSDNKLYVKASDNESILNLCFTKDDVDLSDKQNWLVENITNNDVFTLEKDIKELFVIEKMKDGTTWSSKIIRSY